MATLYDLQSINFGYLWQKQMINVLRDLTLDIAPGSFTCLVGPSGSGKTTLLNLLGLIDFPQKGVLRFNGEDIAQKSPRQLEELRLKQLGFVFQSFYLLPTLSALENTIYFLTPLGYSSLLARQRGEHVLELVGLKDQMHKRPMELSGGQRQRVAIARALAKNPKVILADEPTANLDRKTSEDIIQVFKSLQKAGEASFVFATHDNHLVSYADRVLTLKDGQI